MIYDSRICELGEGAFWHPIRKQFFWFDILHKRLLSRSADGPLDWAMPDMTSAMAWVDADRVLLASETALTLFNLATGSRDIITPLESDNPLTRSNDGRADRQGGFWIGTMGKRGGNDPAAGSIWRWYRGELRRLFAGLTIPNAICFAPDGSRAYFTDTLTQIIQTVALDADGWPVGDPAPFIDLRAGGLYPDGATVDADGNIWNAQWGAGRVACYSPQGVFIRAVEVGAPHSSCPAFGGEYGRTLFVTTATEGMDDAALAAHPAAGQVFALPDIAPALAEPQVIL